MIAEILTLAMAAPPGGKGGQQSPMFMFVWLGIMVAIFYVMLIRPQQRRERERRALIANVKTGDRIVFAGGLLGVVTNVKEKTLAVKIADKVKVEVTRGSVTQVLEKGEAPVEDEKK
jgi:preprotein translocase subunit YajC